MLLSVGKVAIILGVSISILRRWDKKQKFQASMITIGGHRRYDLNEISKIIPLGDINDKDSKEERVTQHTVVTYA